MDHREALVDSAVVRALADTNSGEPNWTGLAWRKRQVTSLPAEIGPGIGLWSNRCDPRWNV